MTAVGRFVLSLERRELLLDGQPVPLGSRAFDILEVLWLASGGLVTKEEVQRRVWPHAVVEDNNLTVHISALRKALGEDRQLIQTVPGRGYRLLVSTTPQARPESDPTTPTPPLAEARIPRSSPIIGREKAVAEVLGLVQTSALVTLVAGGGLGKTQLAFEVARHLELHAGATVRLVQLGAIIDPTFVVDALASSLGVSRSPGPRAMALIGQAISNDEILVVMDNCEHVIDEVTVVCEQIMQLCPGIRILATSREPLRAMGECVYRVPPLETPNAADGVEDIMRSPAAQLFVSRVRSRHSNFSSSESAVRLIGVICKRLDGIPLALELAGARAGSLGIEELASELDEQILQLTGGLRTAPPRHQTLQATFDWSYKLLDKVEQVVLRRVGILVGSFSLDAVRSIAAVDEYDEHVVRDAIAGLTSKSLLNFADSQRGTRYYLHEAARAYALQKLDDYGERRRIAANHATYYQAVFASLQEEHDDLLPEEWLDRFLDELSNVRVALDWCFSADGDTRTGVALAATTISYFFELSLVHECCTLSSKALSASESIQVRDPRAEMRLLACYAAARAYQKGPLGDTQTAWMKIAGTARQIRDQEALGRALWGLWTCAQYAGHCNEALMYGKQFLALGEAEQNQTWTVLGKRIVGIALHFVGEQSASHDFLEQMLSEYSYQEHQWRTIGFRIDHGVAAKGTFARVLWLRGDTGRAFRLADEAFEAAVQQHHEILSCYLLVEAVIPLAILSRDYARAQTYLRMLQSKSRNADLEIWVAYCECFQLFMAFISGASPGLVSQISKAIDALRKIGFCAHLSMLSGMLASAYSSLCLNSTAAAVIDEALLYCEVNGDKWFLAELQRIKGEIELSLERPGSAEAWFRSAMKTSEVQGACALNLQAAVSLARLLIAQGRRDSVKDILKRSMNGISDGLYLKELEYAAEVLGNVEKEA